MTESSKHRPKFSAYCCGQPMKIREQTDSHVEFICATGQHGRWFGISKDAAGESHCSPCPGMLTEDLGAVRLYSCTHCGARYTVFVDGVKVETEVRGISADEVNKVGRETISALWDCYHRMGMADPGTFRSLFKKEIKVFVDQIKGDAVIGDKRTGDHVSIQGDSNVGKAGRDARTEVKQSVAQPTGRPWVRPIIIAALGAIIAAIAIYYLKANGIIFSP